MLDGFWIINFRAATDLGAGVVSVSNGKAAGGDGSFIYTGPINTDSSGKVQGELEIKRHSPYHPSVLPGLDNYSLLISGLVRGDSLELIGKIKGNESVAITIQGRRQAIT